MSLPLVEDEIRRFLQSPAPEVLCIQGSWGVGKTHAWTKCLKDAKTRGLLGLNSYAYVSLFGINSVSEIFRSIFENTTTGDAIGAPPRPETYADNAKALVELIGRKAFGVLSAVQIPFTKDLSTGLVAGAMGLTIRNRIVCLDDLDRKGKDLRSEDVLGLASLLREQKSCKVVIIVNEEGLDELGGKDGFRHHFEKVVDNLIMFNPTPAESARIAIPSDGKVNDALREICVQLSISNIRIIRRIERVAKSALAEISYFHWRVQEEVIKKISVLTWGRFGDGPSLAFLTKQYRFPGEKSRQLSVDESRWSSILDQINWFFDREHDDVLWRGVDLGYFDLVQLRGYGHGKHTNENALSKRDAFHNAWIPFNDSFAHNESEVADHLYNGFKNNYTEISIMNANSTIEILRILGRSAQADELVNLYVDCEGMDVEKVLHGARLFGDITDAGLNEALIAKQRQAQVPKDPIAVLEKLSSQNAWDADDERVLSGLTSADFYTLFKSATGNQLSALIAGALFFAKISNATDAQRQLTNNARAALVQIASESALNRRRVACYLSNPSD